MKKAALAANIGFLLVLGGYVLTLGEMSFNAMELVMLVFAVISPVTTIVVLLAARCAGLGMRLGVGVTNVALLGTLFLYFIEHKPLMGLDLEAEWPVAVLLTSMLIAPTLSSVAVILMRPVSQSRSVSANETASPNVLQQSEPERERLSSH